MINLTIDSSVFAIPYKNNDLKREYKNINNFVNNLKALIALEKCPAITINYIKNIKTHLIISKCYRYKEIKDRINNLKNNNYSFALSSKNIIDYYTEIIEKIGKHNSAGIFNHIPNDLENEKKYSYILFNKYIYNDYKNNERLMKVFIRYLGFIAEMNYKYLSENDNYIVISGNKISNQVIKMDFNNKKTNVNIIGIQKVIKLIPNVIIKSIDILESKIRNEINKNISIGTGVSFTDIENKMSDKSYMYTRVYFYLKTLDNIALIINKNNIEKDEQNLINMINAHGCLCSPDNEKYNNYKCPYRTFINENGIPECFSLHLKPTTETTEKTYTFTIGGSEYNYSTRIYFKLIDKIIFVGSIGKHPNSCTCIEKKCTKLKR